MQCLRASRLLQLYIDGQLDLQQTRALKFHLANCPFCYEDFLLYEEIGQALQGMELVAEPADLTENIMRRVAISEEIAQQERAEKLRQAGLRPSLGELCAAILLATFAMFGIVFGQPAIRRMLPIANGYDGVSLFFIHLWSMLTSINSDTLMLGFWVIGTALGIWITLVLVGAELRNSWLRAVMDRLPVW